MLEPRVPFCAAEKHVDYAAVDNVVLDARNRVEYLVWPAARRLAFNVYLTAGPASARHHDSLGRALAHACGSTYVAGYDQVTAELASLRRQTGRPSGEHRGNRVDAAREITALGIQAAGSYAESVRRFHVKTEGRDDEWQRIERRARQLLHNVVLEIVGRVLNLGRSAAALGGERHMLAAIEQALYAMRSEQLDTNTCVPCDHLHGEVVIVGSPEYVALTPPNECLGRGRCRGIWVYADRLADLRIPSGQQRFPESQLPLI